MDELLLRMIRCGWLSENPEKLIQFPETSPQTIYRNESHYLCEKNAIYSEYILRFESENFPSWLISTMTKEIFRKLHKRRYSRVTCLRMVMAVLMLFLMLARCILCFGRSISPTFQLKIEKLSTADWKVRKFTGPQFLTRKVSESLCIFTEVDSNFILGKFDFT